MNSKNENISEEIKWYRWKGKRISKKQYENKLRLVSVGARLSSIREQNKQNKYARDNIDLDQIPMKTRSMANETVEDKCKIEGRRIINMDTIGDELFCNECHEVLSLKDIKKETQYGLASVFIIRCRKCLFENSVSSDSKHMGPANKQLFDVNSRSVLGVMDAGMGNTHLNKLLCAMDIPKMHINTYQRYEKEVGQAAENIARESCKRLHY